MKKSIKKINLKLDEIKKMTDIKLDAIKFEKYLKS